MNIKPIEVLEVENNNKIIQFKYEDISSIKLYDEGEDD